MPFSSPVVQGAVHSPAKTVLPLSVCLTVVHLSLAHILPAAGTGGENFVAVDEFLRETRRVLVDGGFLVSVSHMDRTGFFEPPLAAPEGDKSWTVNAARLWRVDKSASGVEQRFGYFTYVCQVGKITPQAERHEPEPEVEAAEKDGHDSQTEAVAARDGRLARLGEGGDKDSKQPKSVDPATSRPCDTAATDIVLEWTATAGEIAGAETDTNKGKPSEHSEVRGRVWFELEALPPLIAATR